MAMWIWLCNHRTYNSPDRAEYVWKKSSRLLSNCSYLSMRFKSFLCFSPISLCRRKHGINKSTNSRVCTCIDIDISLSRKPFSNGCCAMCTERWRFPKTVWLGHWVCSQWVDRGWYYWIISVSLTHAAAFCNVNMGQQSKDRTSVLWWMTVQWWRVELCVGRLTSILAMPWCIFAMCASYAPRISSTLCSTAIRTCKPISVRKLSLSRNTESYSSNKLLNRWRISHCHSTFLVHSVYRSVLILTAWYCLQGFDVC